MFAVGFLAALLVSRAAWAAEVFAPPGLVEILPVGEAVADGKTPVTLQVLALQPDGQPLTGLKLKPSGKGATFGEWVESGNGVYRFDVVPAPSVTTGAIEVALKGKSPSNLPINETATIPVLPAPGSGMEVTTNPSVIVLGKTPEASLSFALPNQSGALRVAAGTGEVATITNMGGGRYTARYKVPAVNYPHLAIMTAVDPNNPSANGWAVIPLHGAVNYPVKTSPNATVILRIADRDFGPVQADEMGKASVPVEVPPGLATAKLVSVLEGNAVEESIDLRVPETKRIQLFPLPKSLPATARVRIPVRVVVLEPTGAPDTEADVSLVASAGTMSAVAHEGRGVYLATYTAPESNAQLSVEVKASLKGSSIQEDKLEFTLLPPGPAVLSVNAAPEVLPTGATSFKVFAKALDANGKGISGRNLVFRAAGAKMKDVQDMRGGDYQANFSVTTKGKIEVHAHVAAAAGDNPLRHVLVVPTRSYVPGDGQFPVLVNVLTLDAYGAPVPNVDLKLVVDGGDGEVPETARTDGGGVAQVSYVAGIRAGLVRIVATAQGSRGVGSLLQGPDVLSKVQVPRSGSAAVVAMTAGFDDVMPFVEVTQEGGDGSVAVLEGTGTAKGIIANLGIKAATATIEQGGKVTVFVKATDAAGAPVPGKTLEWKVNTGAKVEGISDLGNGQYEAIVHAAPDLEGEVRLDVTAPTGTTASFVLPVVRSNAPDATAAWGSLTGGDALGGTEAVVPPAPDAAKVRKPKTVSDRPWLRVRASGVGSTYAYTQTPSENFGSLLPEVLSVGRAAGGSNATPVGAEGHARLWVPTVPYVGANVVARGTRYAIRSEAFAGEAADWLYDFAVDAAGRYPFDVGSDQFWVGGRAGFRYTDFMIFRGCLEPNCTVEFGPLPLPGMEFGVDVGAEVGPVYLVGGTSLGIAAPFVRYGTSVDLNAGWQIIDNFFVDAGFTGVWRKVEVFADDSDELRGTLSDSQILFKGGVGFSL